MLKEGLNAIIGLSRSAAFHRLDHRFGLQTNQAVWQTEARTLRQHRPRLHPMADGKPRHTCRAQHPHHGGGDTRRWHKRLTSRNGSRPALITRAQLLQPLLPSSTQLGVSSGQLLQNRIQLMQAAQLP